MVKSNTCVVTGGGGYAGVRLGRALADDGYSVKLFDVRAPNTKDDPLPSTVTFIQGDIRDVAQVEKAFQDANCVFHLASFGMSGREMLNRKLIEEVNVKGTENVIEVCKKLCIPRLVYTSTYNVVFGGQPIINGNEETCKEYFPPEKHCDYYSATKTLAEQRVLAANGTALSDGAVLRTCALRLAGVYGPGEQRHLPRIVGYIEAGLFSMVYGAEDSLVDFLHVDNLVQAHVKVAKKLTDKDPIAAGQAYFISDNKPVNNFEFFRPLVEGLGYKFPTLRLPVTLVFYIELLHSVIGRFYNFQPLLTRAEVYKTGVTHYFSTEGARRDFGYVPRVQNDLAPAVRWFRERGHGKKPKSKNSGSALYRMLVNIVLAVMFGMVVMSFLPSVK